MLFKIFDNIIAWDPEGMTFVSACARGSDTYQALCRVLLHVFNTHCVSMFQIF